MAPVANKPCSLPPPSSHGKGSISKDRDQHYSPKIRYNEGGSQNDKIYYLKRSNLGGKKIWRICLGSAKVSFFFKSVSRQIKFPPNCFSFKGRDTNRIISSRENKTRPDNAASRNFVSVPGMRYLRSAQQVISSFIQAPDCEQTRRSLV